MTSDDTVSEVLRPFLATDRADENLDVLDVSQAAARLQESPESIERLVEEKLLLGWRDSGAD